MSQYKNKKNNSGFTLIEVIIYIALFAIVVGGGMVATYQIISGTDAGTNHVILQEEANFLLRKIDWALTGATSITTPPNTTPTTNLVVSKKINGIPTTLTFEINANDPTNCPLNYLCLKRSSVTQLNSSSISVSGLTFQKTATGNGITTTFTLTTNQNGRIATQNFSTTKYLRQ